MPKSPIIPTQCPSPQWARACIGGSPGIHAGEDVPQISSLTLVLEVEKKAQFEKLERQPVPIKITGPIGF